MAMRGANVQFAVDCPTFRSQTAPRHLVFGSNHVHHKTKLVLQRNELKYISTRTSMRLNKRKCEARAAEVDFAGIKRDPSPEALNILAAADAICFDVDSTFCQDESIDELAAFLGVGEQVAALTSRAMGGTVLFQHALEERLHVMRPSAADMERYLIAHPHLITPGIPELLEQLQSLGKKIFLVSGGFRQIIHPLAESLGIPVSHVFANTILFDPESGAYAGFDPEEFTSRSGGKGEAVVHIKKEWALKTIVMVGDGATDAEARQPGGADLFIGYGGVVFRQGVAEKADWYVMDVAEISQALRR